MAMTRRRWLTLLVGFGLAALAWPSMQTPPLRIVYNASDSVPRGWYRIVPAASLHVGCIVLVKLPAEIATLAAQRGYLPERIPLLKRVGALAPQQVCIAQQLVRIDGLAVANVLHADSQARTLPVWQQCRLLREGELFLLSTTHPASFDSRYVGPLPATAVLGTALPLWTGSSP
jgi:conjugative transfer signal peptidase TraF